jgi:hypothetical protein
MFYAGSPRVKQGRDKFLGKEKKNEKAISFDAGSWNGLDGQCTTFTTPDFGQWQHYCVG